MIPVRLTLRRHPSEPTSKAQYYPAVVSRGHVDLKSISGRIAQMSTLSRTDCTAVITAFLEVLPSELLQGNIVHLDNFGSFRLTVKGQGVSSIDDFSSSHIRHVQMRFNPSKEIKEQLQQADYSLVK